MEIFTSEGLKNLFHNLDLERDRELTVNIMLADNVNLYTGKRIRIFLRQIIADDSKLVDILVINDGNWKFRTHGRVGGDIVRTSHGLKLWENVGDACAKYNNYIQKINNKNKYREKRFSRWYQRRMKHYHIVFMATIYANGRVIFKCKKCSVGSRLGRLNSKIKKAIWQFVSEKKEAEKWKYIRVKKQND